MRRSMDKKLPEKPPKSSPKGKSKQLVDPSALYQPRDLKATTTCFVDEAELQAKGTCVFKGEFSPPKDKKVGLITMPPNLQELGKEDNYITVYRRLGLDGYFRLKPCGVDVQRAYELMTTIDPIGTANITDLEGNEKQVIVNEATVQNALKFKEGYQDMKHRLTKEDHDRYFLNLKGKKGTFDDMSIEEAKPPLKLFTQHFNLKKPQKYTHPHTRIAYSMSLAAKDISQDRPNFAKHVLEQLFEHVGSVNLKNDPYLYASHLLTRIAYQALGESDKLPAPIAHSVPKVPRSLRRLNRGPREGRADKAPVEEDEESSSAGYDTEVDPDTLGPIAKSMYKAFDESKKEFAKEQAKREARIYEGDERPLVPPKKRETKKKEDPAVERTREERRPEVEALLDTDKSLRLLGLSTVRDIVKKPEERVGTIKRKDKSPAQPTRQSKRGKTSTKVDEEDKEPPVPVTSTPKPKLVVTGPKPPTPTPKPSPPSSKPTEE